MNAPNKAASRPARRLTVQETVVFALLGTLMFCSKLLMEFLPNIHLLGTLTMVCTIVFRAKALLPVYIYVMLNGLYAGFSAWWVPYLYVWAVLWAVTMLLPRNLPKKAALIVYPVVCGLHGLAFGLLYAPTQAVLFGLNFEQMIAWIAVGFPADLLHCAGNVAAGMLIVPLSELLRKLTRQQHRI